jgi:hypothetical protein
MAGVRTTKLTGPRRKRPSLIRPTLSVSRSFDLIEIRSAASACFISFQAIGDCS